MMMKKRISLGFHLMEVMIALAIISIVTALSLPLYSQYIAHARRNEAEATISKLAIAMEAYHLEHNTYKGVTLDVLHFPEWTTNHHYQLSIRSAKEDEFLLAAIPQGKQADNNPTCGELTLDARGEKGISGSDRVEDCW